MYGYLIDYICVGGAKHSNKEEKEKNSLNSIFDEYSMSKSLAFFNQSLGPMYDDLAYDLDPHLLCLEPTQRLSRINTT